jgi:hypothetical protein
MAQLRQVPGKFAAVAAKSPHFDDAQTMLSWWLFRFLSGEKVTKRIFQLSTVKFFVYRNIPLDIRNRPE